MSESEYDIVFLEKTIVEIAESLSYYNEILSGLGFGFEEEVFVLIERIKKILYYFQLNSLIFMKSL